MTPNESYSILFKYFALSLFFSILLGYISNFVLDFFEYSNSDEEFKSMGYFEKLLLVCGISPIIETLFFQLVPYCLISKYLTNNKKLTLLLMAFIFSIVHIYNPAYMFFTFLGGLILANFYFNIKKLNFSAFIWTTILHLFYNAYGFFIIGV